MLTTLLRMSVATAELRGASRMGLPAAAETAPLTQSRKPNDHDLDKAASFSTRNSVLSPRISRGGDRRHPSRWTASTRGKLPRDWLFSGIQRGQRQSELPSCSPQPIQVLGPRKGQSLMSFLLQCRLHPRLGWPPLQDLGLPSAKDNPHRRSTQHEPALV